MNLELLKNQIPEYAKDIKLNLSSILTVGGAPDLSQQQIDYLVLASALATKHLSVIESVLTEAENSLSQAEINAAKSAATIMAMNNVYYRFTHLVGDKSFATMPAKLRMNIIGNPGIDKKDFELSCLAISAINGCGMCMEAHTHELVKAGVSKLAIQSAVRIAAVLNAVSQAI